MIEVIFTARNEDGIPSWKLIQSKQKTVTRRLKPLWVGKEFAVQPGRGKKSICRAIVVSVGPHKYWMPNPDVFRKSTIYRCLQEEARREGFKTWDGLLKWFEDNKIDINDTYRIRFEVI